MVIQAENLQDIACESTSSEQHHLLVAGDHESEIGNEPANFGRHDFYVDDGLKSVATVQDAVTLIRQMKEMCIRGGFKLHKFISNKREVIESVPAEDLAKGIKDRNRDEDPLPMERALGVHWCVEADTFEFHIILRTCR